MNQYGGFHFSPKDISPQSIQLVPMADQIAGSDGNLSNWSEGPKAGAGIRMGITWCPAWKETCWNC